MLAQYKDTNFIDIVEEFSILKSERRITQLLYLIIKGKKKYKDVNELKKLTKIIKTTNYENLLYCELEK